MDATTMPSITSLLTKLQADYPTITFSKAADFRWSPPEKTVYYTNDPHADALLLHELSHSLLNHSLYIKDIDLIKMERDAWEKARHLAPQYEVVLSDDIIQPHLDSYRDWLHARSTCPTCGATGVQTKQATYHCVACGATWRVNEARMCGLKRYRQ